MGDQFEPGIHKARSFGRPQDVERIAERRKPLSEAQSNLNRVNTRIEVDKLVMNKHV